MSSVRKEMKRIENRNKANEQLLVLNEGIKEIDKTIAGLYENAKEQLLDNNEEGFEIAANPIFYFQELRSVINTIKIHYQTYIKTAEFMDIIEGIRPVLKSLAKNMNTYPSLAKNNKDFAKFKKSLIRGQLNMKAMGTMMKNLSPAPSSRSKEEYSALKEKIMLENGITNIKTSKVADNKDFFDAINNA